MNDDTDATPCSLTDADRHAAAHWHLLFRGILAHLGVSAHHEFNPEVVEVGEPWPSPGHREARWMAFRDTTGVWMDDSQTGRHAAATMDDALALIWGIQASARAAALALIPPTLLPPLPAAFCCAD